MSSTRPSIELLFRSNHRPDPPSTTIAMTDHPDRSVRTRTVRAALETDTQHGAVVPPIHLTTTFAFGGYGEKREFDYSRSGNPTRDALGRALADLEGGPARS